MNELGHHALVLAWALSLLGVIAGALGGWKRSERWFLVARNASLALGACAVTALIALGASFATNDYRNQYVWQFSNRDMDPLYKITAIWGGMDGSMLLWAVILSVSVTILGYQSILQNRLLLSWTLAAAHSSALFFFTMVTFVTNPFRYIKAPFIPPDGNGLNPLLQNPYMAAHPPMLYLGFTTLAIPYAFCMGALLSGIVTTEWIRLTRRWTLIGWAFLTVGIVLGGHWAYIELGWGGFWAWDPVENASFLPWLTATAFLHSVMVQERKGMLKFWNVWLVVLTYALTVFGTFLTRSGVVQSVHAFASTDVGWVFLLYLGLVVLAAAIATYIRRRELQPERSIDSYLSREAAFLCNNLLLLSICFATIWGVLFPVFSEALTGERQTVGIPFFNSVNGPLFLALLFMMGIGPLIAWRRSSLAALRKTFLVPFLIAMATGALLLFGGITEFKAVLSYSLCMFVLMSIMSELHRGIRIHRTSPTGEPVSVVAASSQLIRRHRVKYGGHFVHFGVLVVAVAITASLLHKKEEEISLRVGETAQIARYGLTLERVQEGKTDNYQYMEAVIKIDDSRQNNSLGVLHPQIRFYPRNRETTTEVALRMSLRDDLYIVLAGVDENGKRAALKVFVNPLQMWLWFGAGLMILGTVTVIIPAYAGLRTPLPLDRLAGGQEVRGN